MKDYFDGKNIRHLVFMSSLMKDFEKAEDLKTIKLGDNTQHIFNNGKYVMTIDWKLI